MQIGQRSAGHCVTGRRSTDREAEVKEAGTVEEEEAEEGLKVVNSKYISGNRWTLGQSQENGNKGGINSFVDWNRNEYPQQTKRNPTSYWQSKLPVVDIGSFMELIKNWILRQVEDEEDEEEGTRKQRRKFNPRKWNCPVVIFLFFFFFSLCVEGLQKESEWGNLEGILRESRKNPEGGRAEGLGVERSSSSPESTFSFSIPLVYWLSFFPRPGISMSTVDLRPFLSSFSFFLSFLNTCHFSSTSRPVIPHHSSFKYRSIKTQHNSWTILPALLSLDGIVDNRSKQHWWIQKIAIDGAG